MTKLYILLAVLLGGLAVGGGTAWQVQEWRRASLDQERKDAADEKTRIDAKRIDVAASKLETDKREVEVQFVEVQKEVERVVEKVVYRDQCLDDDGMRVLRSAIRAPVASEPAAVVRPADGAK